MKLFNKDINNGSSIPRNILAPSLSQELRQKHVIFMNYLARVRRIFVECGSNIPYNLLSFGVSITCSLARRNHSFREK